MKNVKQQTDKNVKPLVSIITVTRNSAKTLEATIQSILNQSYDNIEYIIIDGESHDETLDIINNYKKNIKYLISEKDVNLYDAMNKGLQLSSGEIIGIVNSDDWIERNTVELVVDNMIKYPESDLFHGNINFINDNDEIAGIGKPKLYKSAKYLGSPFYHATCFVTKRAYDKYGMFDIGFPIMADYDLILRLLNHGINAKYINEILSNVRSGGVSDGKLDFNEAMRESRSVKRKNNCSQLPSFIGELIHRIKFYTLKYLKKWNLKQIIKLYRIIKNAS